MQKAIFTSDEFDVESVDSDSVRYAVILQLPFRLRTGPLFRYRSIDENVEIWLRNPTDIPEGTDFSEFMRKRARPGAWNELWTDALVLLNRPEIQESDLTNLSGSTIGDLDLTSNILTAVLPLNEFIVVYAEATGLTHGGKPLRALTDSEFIDLVRFEFTYLCPGTYEFDETDAAELFDWKPERRVISTGMITGELQDLSAETLSTLESYSTGIKKHAFFELGFLAKSEMVARRPLVALVLVCAALEGAHATYLRERLDDPLSGYSKPVELVNNLLREQGISTVIPLTANVWMPSESRPSMEDLEMCMQGIRMRNQIMHATVGKQGYKFRDYTIMEISAAYSGVYRVYRSFVDVLEVT